MVEQEGRTIFNSAKVTLERLNDLFEVCNILKERCRIQGNSLGALISWHSHLWNIYDEIECKCTAEHKKEIFKLFKNLKRLGDLQYKINTEYDGTILQTNHKVYNKYWYSMGHIERYMRKIADIKGMLNPTGSDILGGVD